MLMVSRGAKKRGKFGIQPVSDRFAIKRALLRCREKLLQCLEKGKRYDYVKCLLKLFVVGPIQMHCAIKGAEILSYNVPF
ncbi:hypothetical protein CEXT_319941 [Caerostris extrusa]|uniref:Uncharacterized protein n=1 Tax=Caerostris extrusa TaxID=172846 RepID=A0AAV4MH59_CAEEX|nr:hypothetical protein CEXT_319941 [Caerostris extrusa]